MKTVYVDCRIGSLEMFSLIWASRPSVDCRIGSLEKEQNL